jgi:hypothetical protein
MKGIIGGKLMFEKVNEMALFSFNTTAKNKTVIV